MIRTAVVVSKAEQAVADGRSAGVEDARVAPAAAPLVG
jgi:hypothetical protein